MALDSFFTPIELENGLVSPSKVEELVSLIQQDNIQTGKEDMSRHWSTVAKVLSVTESNDCLRNFIQLGGLKELDRWLQEAHVEISGNEKPMEELAIKVLDALKKLPLDEEGLKECGIRKTVACFLSHKNLEIQYRAESLSACWGNNNDMEDGDLKEKTKVQSLRGCENILVKKSSDNSQQLDCQEIGRLPAQESLPTENSNKEIEIPLGVQDSVSTSVPVDHKLENFDQKNGSNGRLLHSQIREGADDCPTSSVDVDTHKTDALDASSVNSSISFDAQQNHLQAVIRKTESSENTMDLGDNEVPKGEGAGKQIDGSSVPEKNYFEGDPMPSPLKCLLSVSYPNLEQRHIESPSAQIGKDSPDYWKKMMQQQNPTKNNNAKMIENIEPLRGLDEFGISSNKDHPFRSEGVKHDSGVKSGIETMASVAKEKHGFSFSMLEKDNMVEIDRKKLEMDLACGVLDALEVARQVAREVEEEVGIYREASYSSSSKLDMDGEAANPCTADSANVQNLSEAERNESCDGQNSLDISHSSKMDQETSSDNEESCSESEDSQDINLSLPENKVAFHDQDSSQLTNLAWESSLNNKTHLTFDLNEHIQMEDSDCPQHSSGGTVSYTHVKTLLAPIPVVATSREPVGPNATRLLFGVDVGWRETAATSTFCPTSSRTPEEDKAYSNEENSCRIDLNVADGGDAAAFDVYADKHGKKEELFLVSSNLPSDDSSVEVCSKRTGRLNLDLNHIAENFQELSSDRPAGYWLQNQWGVSSALARGFDLNDNPSFNEACASNGPCFKRPSKIARLDASFPFTGSKTPQEADCMLTRRGFYPGSMHQEHTTNQQKELSNLTHPFLVAGSGGGPFVGQTEGKVPVQQHSLAYATQPAFAYNGLSLGFTMLPGSSSQPMGGVPYMVDQRGAAVLPQMLEPSMLVQYPPSLMGATPQRMNDVDVSRPSIDLNAAGPAFDSESRGAGGIKNLLFPGSGLSVEDHLKFSQQISGTGASMKPQESGFSFEPYPVGYKRTWN